MFAGHVGAALAIGRAERRLNVGLVVIAALWLDIALWTFVLLGWESVVIPADGPAAHLPAFVFPYSHGLLAALLWSAVAGVAAFAGCSGLDPAARRRAAAMIAAAVFSHWLLDALVHAPELPLAGGGSPRVGLGLWHDLPLALGVEAGVVAIGLGLFLPGSRLPRGRALALTALALVVLAFTVAGMTLAPPPPSPQVMAGSSLATLGIVCALGCWLGQRPTQHRHG